MELITLSSPIAVSLPGNRVKMVSVVEAIDEGQTNGYLETRLKIVSFLDGGEMVLLTEGIRTKVKSSNIRSRQDVSRSAREESSQEQERRTR